MKHLTYGVAIAFMSATSTGILACSDLGPEGTLDEQVDETEDRLIIQIGGGDDDDDDDDD